MFLIIILGSLEVGWLKKIVVFTLFICWPELNSFAKLPIFSWQSSVLDLQKSKLLFANKRWVSGGLLLDWERPWMSPLKAGRMSKPWIPSVHKRNKKGDRRSHYLIPLNGLLNPCGALLMRIEYETLGTQSIMRVIHLSLKPNFSSCTPKKTTLLYCRPCSCQA